MHTVYWSTMETREGMMTDLSLAYQEPERLKDNIPKNTATSPYGKCPAFFETIKNTYVLKSPVSIKIKINPNTKEYATDNDKVFKEKFIAPDEKRIAQFNFGYIFFSEKPLVMSMRHPYLHHNSITRNGNIAYGEFDIGRWFRNISCAIILDPNIQTYDFTLSNDDIFSYAKFHTDEKVILKRFDMTPKIKEIGAKCFDYKLRKSKGIDSLNKIYDVFDRSLYRKPLLREIKNNLMD